MKSANHQPQRKRLSRKWLSERAKVENDTPSSETHQEKNEPEKEDWIAAACADWPQAPGPDDDVHAHQRRHWALLKRLRTPEQLRGLYAVAVQKMAGGWEMLRDMEGWKPMGRPNFQRLLLAVTRVSPDGDDILEDFDDALEALDALDWGVGADWVGKDGVVSFGLILNEDTRKELVEGRELREMQARARREAVF